MSGPNSQQRGDLGEIIVEHALRKSAFTTGRLSPDLGEDLGIEVDGRTASAQGSFPLRALVQAKGSASELNESFDYDVETKHLRRWAAQPLPVFLVGVELATERFFAKSIDAILAEDLSGQDAMQLATKTVRVHLPAVASLPDELRSRIEDHYRSSQLVLAGIDQHTIEQNYFEVVERKAPETWARIPVASWRVLWKSPRRPQHLAAMLTELARQATREYAASHPTFVVFHIYRSQFDLQRNLATVRVDWVDPSHPKAPDIVRILDAPGGFRLRVEEDTDVVREILRARTATATEFRRYATDVGTRLDEITDELMRRPNLQGWDDQATARFEAVDKIWNEGPDAPAECAQLCEILKRQYAAVFDNVYVAKYRRQSLEREVFERLQQDSLERAKACRGTWRVFVHP